MTADPVTSAGTKVYIGGTGSLGTEAAWVEIGEVITLPQFGRQYDKITYNSLSTRQKVKLKGAYDDGSMTLDLARIPADAGQTAIKGALDDDTSYNFKIELNDAPPGTTGLPTTMTFKGKVFSYTTNVQDVNQVVKAAVMIEVQGEITEVAAH